MSQRISRAFPDNSLPSAQLHSILQEDFRNFLYVLYQVQQLALTCFAELSHSLAGPSLDAFDIFLELIVFPFLMTFSPLLALPCRRLDSSDLTQVSCFGWVPQGGETSMVNR